jgi:hypothetical protein
MDDVVPEDMAPNVWGSAFGVGSCELKDIFLPFFPLESELESIMPACTASSHYKMNVDLNVLQVRVGLVTIYIGSSVLALQ